MINVKNVKITKNYYYVICTMSTSDTELILRTYMVTPTSTGGPAMIG